MYVKLCSNYEQPQIGRVYQMILCFSQNFKITELSLWASCCTLITTVLSFVTSAFDIWVGNKRYGLKNVKRYILNKQRNALISYRHQTHMYRFRLVRYILQCRSKIGWGERVGRGKHLTAPFHPIFFHVVFKNLIKIYGTTFIRQINIIFRELLMSNIVLTGVQTCAEKNSRLSTSIHILNVIITQW